MAIQFHPILCEHMQQTYQGHIKIQQGSSTKFALIDLSTFEMCNTLFLFGLFVVAPCIGFTIVTCVAVSRARLQVVKLQFGINSKIIACIFKSFVNHYRQLLILAMELNISCLNLDLFIKSAQNQRMHTDNFQKQHLVSKQECNFKEIKEYPWKESRKRLTLFWTARINSI